MTQDLSPANIEQTAKVAKRVRNVVIAIVAIALAAALFLGFQTETDTATLDAQASESTPLEVALSNGKPTFLEFYANWCTSCQTMAKDLNEVKNEYSDRVNFVMLNVDNSKWLPEVLRYRVDGIPHFVFLNPEGNAIAQTIGEQPMSVIQTNLDALIANNPIPYTNNFGQVSRLEAIMNNPPQTSDDPRSHGASVK
ncbi:thioredoxin family protein [Oscillatoria salina]|uniref:thioredoxin family protein n=1 Tax=Oscillatoria salina TaxID=331517 RepID=UPI0013BC54AC|nr:thioredoxin family protein [Oscillatoria salina]MBZ8181057.1 thioredoxin fold domain-containing protein [Oscillatoria salina IIICB1]NET91361.1 thioredoxin fold domain-containing protein [Kamptonema sp. SIO1D9]